MPKVTITHDDGSTETIARTLGYRWQREIGEMRKLTITVSREDAEAVTLDRKVDEITLAGVTTARLVDVNTQGATWTLICYSFEWDANREQPTGGGVLTNDTDDALVTDFIGDVDTWTVGTVEEVSGSISLISNHAQPHERLRKLEQKTGGELRYNDDKSVDYVASLGSDKTGSVILSPSNANLEGEITVQNRGRKIDATHVKVIGAHEGEAQFFANLVPASDGRSYENRINYSSPLWSDASDDDWSRWSNKEAATQSEVDAIAEALGEDLPTEHVEAKATVSGVDLELGDTVRVEKSEADLSRDMRVIRIVTKTLQGSNTASVVDELLLSTRTTARDSEQLRVRNSQRLNVAFQGSAVWGTPSGGLQAVDSGLDYQLSFFYPPVEFEHTAELYVKSLPYRAFSSGAASGGDHTHQVEVTHPSHDHDVSIGTTSASNSEFQNIVEDSTFAGGIGWGGGPLGLTTVDDISAGFSDETSFVFAVCSFRVESLSGVTTGDFDVYIDGGINEPEYPDPNATFRAAQGEEFTFAAVVGTDVSGNTLSLEIVENSSSTSGTISASTTWQLVGLHNHTISDTETSTTALGTTDSETSDASGDHTHPVNPGVTEFPGETASGCDVIVNGNTVETDIGSGEFETVVDISGDLDKGAWNTVEIASDSLGLLNVTAALEAYRQLGVN